MAIATFHRYVKPNNIIMASDGTPILRGLGLFRDRDPQSKDVLNFGKGNIVRPAPSHYMAPEQMRNARNCDARSDIYSLAATLYHLVTGKVPFDYLGVVDAWNRKVNNKLTPQQSIAPSLSERVDMAIRRAMDGAPSRRPANCREFIEDLLGPSEVNEIEPSEPATAIIVDAPQNEAVKQPIANSTDEKGGVAPKLSQPVPKLETLKAVFRKTVETTFGMVGLLLLSSAGLALFLLYGIGYSFLEKRHPFIFASLYLVLLTLPLSVNFFFFIREKLSKQHAEEKHRRDESAARARWRMYYESKTMDEVSRMSGTEFEEFLARLFSRMGFTDIRLTPPTNDQGGDLLCLSPSGTSIVIQAKRWKGTVGNAAVQELLAAMLYYDRAEGMVVTNSKFTEAARELAKKTSRIALCDQRWLEEQIKKFLPREIPDFSWEVYSMVVKDYTPARVGGKRKYKPRHYRRRRWQ